jgi:hypothetical protein
MQITETNLQHATHINETEWMSLKKIIMNDLSICKILDANILIHNTEPFLIKSCLAVVQVLYLTSLKLTLKCISDKYDVYIDSTYFNLEIVLLSHRQVLVNTEIKPQAKLLTSKCIE